MKWILSLIITLVLSISGYCEILPDGTKFNLYDDFSGGLNTRDPPHKLQVNESPYIRNCYIDEGEIDPPGGTIIIGSTNTLTKINLLKRFVKSDGNVEYIVSDSSIVLKTQDFTNYALIKSGLNQSYKLRAKQIENKIYFTNGSDSVFNYDGSTVVVLDGGTYNIGKTPNVPKFKYIEYYQNRMWGFNLPDNPSALRWDLLLSTDTVPIAYPPDHELAWSNSNLQLNIDKGNGTVGTFLRVYAGQLFVGKERGIHYIYGNEDTNYSAVPIVKDYGFLTDESVVEQDNVLTGYGNDGIYEFNGQQMTRISDKIFPDIQNFNLGVLKNVTLTWDNQPDFRFGTFSASTANASGYLTSITSQTLNTQTVYSQLSSLPQKFIFSASGYNTKLATSTDFMPLSYKDVRFGSTNYGYIGYVNFDSVIENNSNAIGSFTVINDRTGQVEVSTFLVAGNDYYSVLLSSNNEPSTSAGVQTRMYPPRFVGATASDVLNGHVKFKLDFSTPNCIPGWYIYVASINLLDQATVRINYSSSSFISEISTSVSNSGWNLFNSVNNINNGAISFSYRASTSPVNITTYPFIPISPGAVIGSSQSNNYIQWAASFTNKSINSNPYIDNVTIIYQQGGGADNGPIGLSWKNRYYLSVTTTSTGDTSLIYVKSRSGTKNPYGWTVLEGINTKSLLATPDVWYGGSSTAGIVMRMDYGTNFNGSPINQVYDTNENNFEQPFLNKNILEFGLDTDYVSNSTYTLAMSIDRGSYVAQDINNSGSGRMIRRLAYPNQKGNSFRWRFSNNQLDRPMKIYNWIAYFKENATRTNTP